MFNPPQPNQYMIALKMTSPKDARDFALHFQKRKFNQIEDDVCLVYQLLGAVINSQAGSDEIIDTSS